MNEELKEFKDGLTVFFKNGDYVHWSVNEMNFLARVYPEVDIRQFVKTVYNYFSSNPAENYNDFRAKFTDFFVNHFVKSQIKESEVADEKNLELKANVIAENMAETFDERKR